MAELTKREQRVTQREREIKRYSVPAEAGDLDIRRARKGAREMAGGSRI